MKKRITKKFLRSIVIKDPEFMRPDQLDRLAAQLPGATPAKAKVIEDKLVAGFYGDMVRAFADSGRLVFDYSASTLPALVARIFPEKRVAAKWMKTPCPGLGGKIPARLAKTKSGRAEVKGFLIGVGSGNFQ